MIASETLQKFSPQAQVQALKAAARYKLTQDLFHFSKTALGYEQMTEQTHKPITNMLQDPTRKKLLVVPRGCFKSSICSISFPTWLLIRDPNERILLDSELFTNSSRFLREIKGHMKSPRLTKLFGEFEGEVWNDTEIIIKQRTKVYKEGSITCSGVAANKTGQHYSTIIADDLSSLDNAMTEENREKVINHYKLYISLLDPGGLLVVVGTRYAYGDIIGHICENELTDEQRRGIPQLNEVDFGPKRGLIK